MNAKFFLVSVLLVSVFFFSGCTEAIGLGSSSVSFSDGVDSLNAVFEENGIQLDVFMEVEALAAIEDSSFDAIDAELEELKNSFTLQELKDLSDVYLVLSEQYKIRSDLSKHIMSVNALEEDTLEGQCAQLPEFDLLVEKTQAVVDSYSKLNQKIASFTTNYPVEAGEAYLEIYETDEEEAFEGFTETKEAVDALKESCAEEPLLPLEDEEEPLLGEETPVDSEVTDDSAEEDVSAEEVEGSSEEESGASAEESA